MPFTYYPVSTFFITNLFVKNVFTSCFHSLSTAQPPALSNLLCLYHGDPTETALQKTCFISGPCAPPAPARPCFLKSAQPSLNIY